MLCGYQVVSNTLSQLVPSQECVRDKETGMCSSCYPTKDTHRVSTLSIPLRHQMGPVWLMICPNSCHDNEVNMYAKVHCFLAAYKFQSRLGHRNKQTNQGLRPRGFANYHPGTKSYVRWSRSGVRVRVTIGGPVTVGNDQRGATRRLS